MYSEYGPKTLTQVEESGLYEISAQEKRKNSLLCLISEIKGNR